jgi:hypothetical protein
MPRFQPGLEYASCRRWTEREARAALVAQGASGLSVPAFAQREGLDVTDRQDPRPDGETRGRRSESFTGLHVALGRR